MNLRWISMRVPVPVFTVALALLLPVMSAAQPAASSPRVIVAQGASSIKVAPDQAWVNIGVETRDARAPEARRLAAASMTTVMTALKAAGVPGEAITTIGFSLNPDYEYVNGRQRMRGFVVANQVQVRIDDITRVAEVLDAVGALSLPSSSNVTLGRLRFDLKNRAQIERDALRLAVEDAVLNAKAMAAGAGVSLGRLSRIDTMAGPPRFQEMGPVMAMDAREGGGGPTPVSPSEIEIRTAVTVTMEIT